MEIQVGRFLLFLFPLLCNGLRGSQIKSLTTEDTNCDECPTTMLKTEGGFAEKYPRYVGTWNNVGTYREMPIYMCLFDCQALKDMMVSNRMFYIDMKQDWPFNRKYFIFYIFMNLLNYRYF